MQGSCSRGLPVTFVVFAIASMAWSLGVLRSVVSKARRRVFFIVTSALAVAAALASAAMDLRSARIAASAHPSNVGIRVVRQGDWWQLEYARPGLAVTTANELHVPAGQAVRVTWTQAPVPSIRDAVFLADDTLLVVEGTTPRKARFASLWPPMWRHLTVVADPPAQFERWLEAQARPVLPANPRGAFLFVDSGCGYCHVLRGVTASPSVVAPDLTHFASRRTLAATDLPITPGMLAGWVVHSRGVKPSSAMPENALDPHALHALTAYLESLR